MQLKLAVYREMENNEYERRHEPNERKAGKENLGIWNDKHAANL